jgi:hypothetical protein
MGENVARRRSRPQSGNRGNTNGFKSFLAAFWVREQS